MGAIALSLFFMGATGLVSAQVPQQPQPMPQQQPMQQPTPQQSPMQQQRTQQQQPFQQQEEEQSGQRQQLQNLEQNQQNTKVSDKELKQFASVYPKVQAESQKEQQEMVKVIEKDGMKLQRFNELQTAKMQHQKLNADKEELKTFKKIKKELDKKQPEMEKRRADLIKSSGLSVERFQAIAVAIQNNPDLKSKFQKIMADDGGKA